VPVLDTNVRRVLSRIAHGPDDSLQAGPSAQWALAAQALPDSHAYPWNQALMDLGATTCSVRAPKCLLCPARQWCSAAGRIPPSMLRERKATYSTNASAPYAGSSRYYRGRIVDRLRRLADDESISPRVLGTTIKPGYSDADAAWLDDLLRALEREGLVARHADGTVALP